jgi:hypothetical protein
VVVRLKTSAVAGHRSLNNEIDAMRSPQQGTGGRTRPSPKVVPLMGWRGWRQRPHRSLTVGSALATGCASQIYARVRAVQGLMACKPQASKADASLEATMNPREAAVAAI